MLMNPSAASHGPKSRKASGRSGKLIRSIPYSPIFRSTAARITLIAVGASTCASGSHVWNGKTGTLTANATKNARKSAILISLAHTGVLCVSATRSNV